MSVENASPAPRETGGLAFPSGKELRCLHEAAVLMRQAEGLDERRSRGGSRGVRDEDASDAEPKPSLASWRGAVRRFERRLRAEVSAGGATRLAETLGPKVAKATREELLAVGGSIASLVFKVGYLRDSERMAFFASLGQPLRSARLRALVNTPGSWSFDKLDSDLCLTRPFFTRFFAGRKMVEAAKRPPAFPRPGRILARLDEQAVGQAEAKQALAALAWRHGLQARGKKGLPRTCLLLVGPTGCGKTFLCRNLARSLSLPFVSFSATQLSSSGYVGASVEDMLARLFREAQSDLDLAQRGVVFIDEFDKIRLTGTLANSNGEGRDIKGRGVQEELLTLLEGSRVQLQTKGSSTRDLPDMETGGLLFILGGAFTDLPAIRARRLRGGKPALGFGAAGAARAPGQDPAYTAADLEEYGLIPELVGRIGSIVELQPLQEADLAAILERPSKGLLNEYRALAREAGLSLDWSPDLPSALARKALLCGLGARGLRHELEVLLRPLAFGPKGGKAWLEVEVDRPRLRLEPPADPAAADHAEAVRRGRSLG